MKPAGGFRLASWVVRPDLGTLTDAEGNTCRLEPKLMSLLQLLAEHAPNLVTRDEILGQVWPGTHVSASGLTRNMSQLRKLLGDDPREPRYIETVPKRGYRLLIAVTPLSEEERQTSRAVAQTTKTCGQDEVSGDNEETDAGREADPTPLLPPTGPGFGRRVLIVGTVFLLLVSLLWMVRNGAEKDEGKQHSVNLVDPVEDASLQPVGLAVLPLIHRGEGEPWFADGLTEELIDLLGKIDGLQLVARTSSFAVAGQQLDVREVGRRLDASRVLEGSVLRSNDLLRISIRLIDTTTGFQLWSEVYERTPDDLFQLQREIAGHIAIRLEAETDHRTLPVNHPRNMAAYDLYLLGQYWCHKGSLRDFPTAIDYFEKATDVDPGYARAWSSLARTWLLLGLSRGAANEVYLPKAREAAMKALALDADQDEAHSAMGMIALCTRLDVNEAENAFRKAIAIHPRNPLNRLWYAGFLRAIGDDVGAATQARMGARMDPFNAFLLVGMADIYIDIGRYEDAARELERALELAPDLRLVKLIQVKLLERRDGWAPALAAYREIDPEEVLMPHWLARAYAYLDQEEPARELLNRVISLREQGGPISAFEQALIHLALGEQQQAFALIEEAQAAGDPDLLHSIALHPGLETLRQQERFRNLVQELNLRRR